MNVGHLVTRKNNKNFSKRFRVLKKLEETEHKNKPLRFFMEETEEEILAWRNGYKLALKLKIPLNEHDYMKYAATFVMGYMAHATVNRTWLLR